MASTLTLTFTGAGVADESFDITGGGKILTFKTQRLATEQVSINTNLGKQIYEFAESLELDYNEDLVYTITPDYEANTIAIEHFDNDHFDSFIDSASNISAVITTTTQEVIIFFDTTFVAASSDQNTQVSANLTINQSITKLNIKESLDGVLTEIYNNDTHNSNSHTLDVRRGRKLVITIDDVVYPNIDTPEFLEITEVLVNGNDVEIISNIGNQFGYNQSLVTSASYFSQANFTSLVANEYVAWVQDLYGGVAKQAFTVQQQASTQQKFASMFVSQKNSVYFANKTEQKKNPLSTLSFEDDYPVKAEDFTQTFHTGQILPIQWKSNFPFHQALLYECDSTDITLLNVTTVKNNIRQFTFLDCQITVTTGNYLRFTFSGGNEYDANGSVIGTHNFNNTFPFYLRQGTKVRLYGIDGIVTQFIEEAGVNYALTNIQDSNVRTDIVRITTKAKDHDVFQTVFNPSQIFNASKSENHVVLRLQGFYRIPDAKGQDAPSEFLSEKVRIVDQETFENEKWHECIFYNKYNDTELVFAEQINNNGDKTKSLRVYRNLKYIKPPKPLTTSEIETEKLDHEVKKLDYKSTQLVELRLDRLPMLNANSVARLFNESEFIEVDGLVYTTIPECEVEELGQYGIPKPQLALVGRATELKYESNTIRSYYPVEVG